MPFSAVLSAALPIKQHSAESANDNNGRPLHRQANIIVTIKTIITMHFSRHFFSGYEPDDFAYYFQSWLNVTRLQLPLHNLDLGSNANGVRIRCQALLCAPFVTTFYHLFPTFSRKKSCELSLESAVSLFF